MDTALVKCMTGGDSITARRLYQEYVTFTPQFTPVIVSNHMPEIDADDPAIWRRLFILPFQRVFQPHEQDQHLARKLEAEMPGILNWAVAGAVAWYQEGLNPPEAVLRAVSDYRAEMDVIGSFIEDCCAVDPQATVPTSALYSAFKVHCRSVGVEAPNQLVFGKELGRRGYPNGTVRISVCGRA